MNQLRHIILGVLKGVELQRREVMWGLPGQYQHMTYQNLWLHLEVLTKNGLINKRIVKRGNYKEGIAFGRVGMYSLTSLGKEAMEYFPELQINAKE